MLDGDLGAVEKSEHVVAGCGSQPAKDVVKCNPCRANHSISCKVRVMSSFLPFRL